MMGVCITLAVLLLLKAVSSVLRIVYNAGFIAGQKHHDTEQLGFIRDSNDAA